MKTILICLMSTIRTRAIQWARYGPYLAYASPVQPVCFIYKGLFLSLLRLFIAQFILIVAGLILGLIHFQSDPYKTILNPGQIRAAR